MTSTPIWDKIINFTPIKKIIELEISKKLMKNKVVASIFNYEMITYLFFGVATTVVNWVACFLLFAIFQINTQNPEASQVFLTTVLNAVAFVISLLFAFFTNKYFVFESKGVGVKKTIIEFFSFTTARLFTFLIETALIALATYLTLNLVIFKILASIIVVILNYVFSKLFIFKKSKE